MGLQSNKYKGLQRPGWIRMVSENWKDPIGGPRMLGQSHAYSNRGIFDSEEKRIPKKILESGRH